VKCWGVLGQDGSSGGTTLVCGGATLVGDGATIKNGGSVFVAPICIPAWALFGWDSGVVVWI
jgi:hypothetical protein